MRDLTNLKTFIIDSKDPKEVDDAFLEYINVWDLMLNEDGTRMPDLYVEDGLHMNPKGYEIWTQRVRESLNKDFSL